MVNTFIKIETVTVGVGGSASITFSSIPQTYSDLKIVLSGRTAHPSSATGQYITFNGSTSNFGGRYLYTDATTAPSSGILARYAGTVMSAAQTANVFNSTQIYISNYTTSNFKSFSVDNVAENNAAYGGLNIISGLWSDTAAITSISLAPDNGNYPQYSTATLYGILNNGGYAAGGNRIYTDGTYWYHQFLATGTSAFVPTRNLNVDYLVVGGGGGGGGAFNKDAAGGGGGAGAVITGSLSVIANTSYTATVGGGGPGGTGVPDARATVGSNSVLGSITANGGAGGGTYSGSTPFTMAGTSNGNASGSGAGGAGTTSASGGSGGTYGFAGGSHTGTGQSNSSTSCGGGGGAGGVGGNGVANSTGGAGGVGITTTITGTSLQLGGGGAGGSTQGATGGGSFGGGNRGNPTLTGGNNGGDGTVNTGGGGGGASAGTSGGNTGGAGGSGIIVIRYAV
jgi:hypothetical protein